MASDGDDVRDAGARSPTHAASGERRRSKSRSRSRSRRRSPSRSPIRSRSRDRRRQSRSPRRISRSPRRSSRSPLRSRSRDRRRAASRSPSRDRYRRRSPSRDRHRRSRSRSRGRHDSRRQPSPQRRQSPPPRGSQLFIAGIPFMMTERDMWDKLERYGKVREVRIVRGPTGESRGFGFAAMEDAETAEYAVRKLDGSDWSGRRLLVEIAKNPR